MAPSSEISELVNSTLNKSIVALKTIDVISPQLDFDTYIENLKKYEQELDTASRALAAPGVDPSLANQLLELVANFPLVLDDIDHRSGRSKARGDLQQLVDLYKELENNETKEEARANYIDTILGLYEEIQAGENTDEGFTDQLEAYIRQIAKARYSELPPLEKKLVEICRRIYHLIDPAILTHMSLDIGQHIRRIIISADQLHYSNPEFQPTTTLLNKYYEAIESPNPRVRHHAIEYYPNLYTLYPSEEAKVMEQRFLQFYANQLIGTTNEEAKTADEIATMLYAVGGERVSIRTIAKIIDEDKSKPELICQAFAIIANKSEFTAAASCLRILNQSAYIKLIEYLGIATGNVLGNSNQLYSKFALETYKPNEHLDSAEHKLVESELAQLKLPPNHEINFLDAAMGSVARHSEAFVGHEINGHAVKVLGFDLFLEHLKNVRSKTPVQNVAQANWNKLPFAANQFDFISLLGRSAHHALNIEEMRSLLLELNRICSTGGEVLLDLAEYGSGHYDDNPKQVHEQLNKFGFEFVEKGVLFDSANGEDVIQRFAPETRQFIAIVWQAGFDIELVAEEEFSYQPGQINKNLYWRLVKRPAGSLSQQQFNFINKHIETTHYPLHVSYY